MLGLIHEVRSEFAASAGALTALIHRYEFETLIAVTEEGLNEK
jgi:hypothetical protein